MTMIAGVLKDCEMHRRHFLPRLPRIGMGMRKIGIWGSNQTDMLTLDDFRTSCGGNAEDLTILSGKSVSMLSLKINWKSHELQERSRTHQTAWSTGICSPLIWLLAATGMSLT